MKAKLLTISAAVMALLAVSCQREETGFGLPAGEEVTVTLSASVPTGGPAVKSAENPGNGSEVNRCILGVYMVKDESSTELYGTLEYEGVGTDGTATFEDVILLTGYDYKLVFWADNVASTTNLQTDNHYVTKDFPTVTYNTADGHQYMSSDDTRDAFYGVFDLTDFSGEVADSYTLTRPFGQLNIFTTDYDDIKSDALKPAKVQMAFTSIPTGMNLISGTLTEPAEGADGVTGEISDIPNITNPVVTGAQQLSFDYIFAPEGQQRMISGITMRFYDENDNELGITPYSFPELPVQANYRTNVSGALLTKSADLKIDISEDFDETLEKDVYTVSTLEKAEQILNDIASSASPQPEIISITVENQISSTDGQNFIELPAITTEVELILQGGIASDATFTVQDIRNSTGSGNDFTGMLVLNNPSTEQQGTLVINLPKGFAEVAGGSYTSVQVTTADDTFVLGEGGYIETLTVNGGNVEIYGRVENIEFRDENSLVTVFTVYDAESLRYAASLVAQNRCAKIVLGADIDLKGSAENPWEPIGSGLGDGVSSSFVFKEFDGNCKVISNLYVHNHKAISGKPGFHYAGFFYTFSGTIKDLTIKNAYVYGSRSSVLVGRFDGGIIENCNIYDSEVYGVQKNAMIAGFINNTALDVTIRGCVVRNGEIKTIPPADNGNATNFQSGGISGFLYSYNRNILIQDNVVDNISIPDADRTATGSSAECVSHDFVGNLLNNSSIDCSNYTVEFKNNKILNCNNDLPKNPVCTEFIGWYYSNALSPKIIVDGKQLNY